MRDTPVQNCLLPRGTHEAYLKTTEKNRHHGFECSKAHVEGLLDGLMVAAVAGVRE